MDKFKLLPHTADVMVKVTGKTRGELFTNAAKGLLKLIGARGGKGAPFKREIKLRAQNPENLLISFLNEINYITMAKKAVIKGLRVRRLSKTRLVAGISGLKNVEKPKFMREIKAATYHNISIDRTKAGLASKITFDI